MTKEQYLKNRKELMNAAENLIAEGNFEESEAKMAEIKELDNQWEQAKLANANLNALKDNETVINLEDKSVDVKGEKPVENIQPPKATNEKETYLKAWAKEMMGMQLENEEKMIFQNFNNNINNALQTASQHAVLIPETVRNGIWREAQELFPILGDARLTFVPGDFTIIKETDGGADGAWYDEDTEVTDGNFQLGELNLTGCELAKSIPVSWKLRKMSIDQFVTYIQTLLAEKMGAALAKGMVSGAGKPGVGDTFKPQPKGIVTALEAETDAPQVIEYDTLNYDLLAKSMGVIKSSYKTGAVIYAKSTVIWDVLATLKDNDGRPLFIPDVTTGGIGRMFGLTVKEEDSVPEGGILLGNVARGYAMNANEDISIYTEDHVKQRRTDYMGYAIVDGDVLSTKAFAYIKYVPVG